MNNDQKQTTAGRYRKKPVVIEAMRFDGSWVSGRTILDWIDGDEAHWRGNGPESGELIIRTLEGDHLASPGDWIIRGVNGEHYPCKPDIFRATYDEVISDEH